MYSPRSNTMNAMRWGLESAFFFFLKVHPGLRTFGLNEWMNNIWLNNIWIKVKVLLIKKFEKLLRNNQASEKIYEQKSSVYYC